MNDKYKTRRQIENELAKLRRRIADLELSDAEHSRLEDLLLASEERYRLLAENVTDVIWTTDMNLGFTYISPSVTSVLGYSVEEVIALSLRELTTPTSLEVAMKAFAETPSLEEIDAKNPPWSPTLELELKRKDGSTIWVEVKSAYLLGRNSQPLGFVGVGREITQRKQAEELLRESEMRYRLLVESLSDVVWIFGIDTPHRLTYISPSVTQLLGYSVEEAMSKGIEEVLTPASLKIAMDTLAMVSPDIDPGQLNQHEPLMLELELIRKDSSTVPVEVKYTVMRGTNAQSPRILAVARDITERKALEAERLDIERKAQLTSRLAAIGEMAAGIAHEINNPLTSVVGFSDLLMRREVPETIRRDLEIINEGAKRVAAIIKRLSVFARQSKPLRRRIDINKITENAVKLRAYHLHTSGIEVEIDLAPDLPETLADGRQMTEVFLNIIANAETEMNLAHGKGRLLVRTRKTDGNIRISFQDDGPGISAENMHKLFSPFFTTRPVGMGTGLGLSICYGIITQHGGRIWAESEFGRGATFLIELPVTQKQEPVDQQGQGEETLTKTSRASLLVVDDEPTVREFLSRVLTESGYEVDVVEDGLAALNRIEDRGYDAILVDIKMPPMSGIELYRRFREIDEVLALKVILVTGDVLGSKTSAFVSEFKVPLVTKPIDLEELDRKITAVLTQSERLS
jgi:PAS domain S-box-containing protein